MFCCCFKYIFVISVRRIISTSTGPIQRRRHWTNLHEICKIARILAVDERSDIIFFDTSRDVAVATNLVGKIDTQYSPCSSHDIR